MRFLGSLFILAILSTQCLAFDVDDRNVSITFCSHDCPKPLLDIGQGAFLRGPITVRNDKGETIFSLEPGQVVGDR